MNKKLFFIFVLLINNTCFGFTESNTRLILSPSLLHFDYTEFNTIGNVLDRELGWLPGIEIKLNHSLATDWSTKMYAAYYSGTVDYKGQTQQGAFHNTDTGTNLLRFGAQIERAFYEKTYLFLGIQSHQWKRNIRDNNNISGLSETYQWNEYSIGIHSDVFTYPKDLFSIEIAYLLIRSAIIDVNLSTVDLGSATLDIGNDKGTRLNLNWEKINEKNIHYGLTLFFEVWHFGRSNTKLTQGGSSNVFITEPKSETRNIGIKFNIEYHY